MVRTMLKQIAVVAPLVVGIAWNAVEARWSPALAGPTTHPFHIDMMLMYVAGADATPVVVVDRAPTELPGAPGSQPASPPRAPGAHVITAGEAPSLRQSPPGSVIALPGGGFIATPGAAPVFVGPPGAQRTRIVTP